VAEPPEKRSQKETEAAGGPLIVIRYSLFVIRYSIFGGPEDLHLVARLPEQQLGQFPLLLDISRQRKPPAKKKAFRSFPEGLFFIVLFEAIAAVRNAGGGISEQRITNNEIRSS
jgi:hypothetical protein